MAAKLLTINRLKQELEKFNKSGDGDLAVVLNDQIIMFGFYDGDEFEPGAWLPTTGDRYEDLSLLRFEELDG